MVGGLAPERRRTQRLLLRGFTDADREPFAALNSDPAVMEHFPSPVDRARSDALVDRVRAGWADRGWGLWAVERADTGEMVGFTGLSPATFDAPFTPAVEVGWRLARAHWGQGFATEAALASLRVAFEDLGVGEVVSFTAVTNSRSRAVMERLGMHRDPADDFPYPSIPEGHPLRPHVLYRLDAATWRLRQG
ncbi:GNAT family N-acetyltransferase [Aquipuribacter hungaricus]|uniref:GNAT family N-acetyltransferase n=1 Tax=Aquipuribacter hungaricus TaxID=545624 RepID=A0ABV7WEY9_9MICO